MGVLRLDVMRFGMSLGMCVDRPALCLWALISSEEFKQTFLKPIEVKCVVGNCSVSALNLEKMKCCPNVSGRAGFSNMQRQDFVLRTGKG